jgi:single-strand DNA-binding protein
MGDLAVAVIVGRLTRDAELKYTTSGTAICAFSIATNSRVKKGDQWVDEPSYWDVDLFGKKGESVSQYLTKGKLVAVEGDMRQDKWEKDGQTRMKVRVNANDVQLLGGSGEGRAPGPQAGSGNEPRQGGWQQGGQGGRYGEDRAPSQGPGPGGNRGYGQAPRPAPREPDRGPQGPGGDFTDDIPF